MHLRFISSSQSLRYFSEPPAGQLRLANQDTTQYTEDLLTAVSKMFPSSLFSTGGDEINMNCYNQDNQTQTELGSSGLTLEQALDRFTNASHSALRAQGKTPVVWEGTIQNNISFFCKQCADVPNRNGARTQCYLVVRYYCAVCLPLFLTIYH